MYSIVKYNNTVRITEQKVGLSFSSLASFSKTRDIFARTYDNKLMFPGNVEGNRGNLVDFRADVARQAPSPLEESDAKGLVHHQAEVMVGGSEDEAGGGGEGEHNPGSRLETTGKRGWM